MAARDNIETLQGLIVELFKGQFRSQSSLLYHKGHEISKKTFENTEFQ